MSSVLTSRGVDSNSDANVTCCVVKTPAHEDLVLLIFILVVESSFSCNELISECLG